MGDWRITTCKKIKCKLKPDLELYVILIIDIENLNVFIIEIR